VPGENGQDLALVANAMPHSATVELSSDAHEDLKKFAEEYRQDLQVNDAQKLLIGFGWVLPEELRKFQMHPEVLHFDATKGTNKEKRPCSCCHFEQNGIVCSHCMAVLIFVDHDYQGVVPSDICVAWWADFELFAYRTKGLEVEQLEYAKTLEMLRENDVTGPRIDVLKLPRIPILSVEEMLAGLMPTDNLVDYCHNYSAERLHNILQNSCSEHITVGLSQDIFVVDNDEDSIKEWCDDEPCVGHPCDDEPCVGHPICF
jgi:hypothetical protein